jgi:hypothetical protein
MSDPVQTAPGPTYQPGQLGRDINALMREQDAQLSDHAGELRVANRDAAAPGKPTTSAITEMHSELEDYGRALGEGSPGYILKNLFKMGLNAFNVATGQGFGFLASEYQALQFNSAWQKFETDEYLRKLIRMVDGHLDGAKEFTRRLANLTARSPDFDASGTRSLLHRKQYIGDGLGRRIDDALANAKTPEDRARLEKLKGDVHDWLGKRDSTVKAEFNDFNDLEVKMAVTGTETRAQSEALDKAADVMQKANGLALHTSPEALFFVGAMREALMGARTRLTQAISTISQHQ